MARTRIQHKKGDTAQAQRMPFLKLALGFGLVLVLCVAMGAGAQNMLKGQITRADERTSAKSMKAAELVKNYGKAALSPAVADAIKNAEKLHGQNSEGAKAASDRFEEQLKSGTLPGLTQLQTPGMAQTRAFVQSMVPPGMTPEQVGMPPILTGKMPYENLYRMPRMPQPMTPEMVAKMAGEPIEGIGTSPDGATKDAIAAQNQKMMEEEIRDRFGPIYMPPLHRDHNSAPTKSKVATTIDHDGSIREMTDPSGNVVAEYSYDPFGTRTKIAGSGPDADFGFAGMYAHPRSNLYLTLARAYSPSMSRWLSRDPLGGVNLYTYCGNNPISNVDPLGLDWNTGNFVGHYYDQSGTAVDLGSVGLGGAFENSASVTQAVNNFNNVLSGRAMAIAQANCDKKKSCGDQTVNADLNASFGQPGTYVGGAGVQDPLFSVGHSTFFTHATCQFTFDCSTHSFKFSCNNQFSIKDMFQDPLGNGKEYGGKPYPINYSFSRTSSGSGSF